MATVTDRAEAEHAGVEGARAELEKLAAEGRQDVCGDAADGDWAASVLEDHQPPGGPVNGVCLCRACRRWRVVVLVGLGAAHCGRRGPAHSGGCGRPGAPDPQRPQPRQPHLVGKRAWQVNTRPGTRSPSQEATRMNRPTHLPKRHPVGCHALLTAITSALDIRVVP